MTIPVPPGTILKDPVSGTVLNDLSTRTDPLVFLEGGMGGKGNKRFATSTRRAPRYAQPGEPGQERALLVELDLLADIGLVGLPNAGKSTLLATLTAAQPKIASYPFTTIIPNLGVVHLPERDFIVCDIPGIIEGASSGAGLGLRFLKHISRTRALVLLVDLGDPDFIDAVSCLKVELDSYRTGLLDKRRLIVGTKLDLPGAHEALARLRDSETGEEVLGISSHSGEGLKELKEILQRIVSEES